MSIVNPGMLVDCQVPMIASLYFDSLHEVMLSATTATGHHWLGAGATRAEVLARTTGGELVVEVHDNGTGGADPVAGGGLVGLADRVAVHRGVLKLSSPAGGPTLLRVEIPVSAQQTQQGQQAGPRGTAAAGPRDGRES